MAYANKVKAGYAIIQMGDGAQPEVFTPICGILTQGITAQVNTNDQFDRDCADPEKVPVRVTTTTGRQWDLSGSGVVNLDNIAALTAAQGKTKNFRYALNKAPNQTGTALYYAGPGKITNLQIGGTADGFASLDITIVSDGEWVVTPAA